MTSDCRPPGEPGQSGSTRRRTSETVTACPPRITRLSSSRMWTMPPRQDTWAPTNSLRPVRVDHHGARVQWAEPVTGSSGIPTRGAKTRDTQSMPGWEAAAVTIMARVSIAARAVRSGCSCLTVSGSAHTTIRSKGATEDVPDSTEGGEQTIGRSTGCRRVGWEVHLDQTVVSECTGEYPASGVELSSPHHVGRSQRGMPTEVDFGGRSKPPQVVPTVGAGDDERRLREVHLAGHVAHPRFRCRSVEPAHRGRVAGEWTIGECVDHDEFSGHDQPRGNRARMVL